LYTCTGLFIINVSNIVVGVENHTDFGCAPSPSTDRLVSQAGGGLKVVLVARSNLNREEPVMRPLLRVELEGTPSAVS
jgi:hypothetical protein